MKGLISERTYNRKSISASEKAMAVLIKLRVSLTALNQ